MKSTATVLCLIALCLAALDLGVHTALGWAERTGRVQSLVQYFEYGRSVPGKLERWAENPDMPGNLQHVGWRSELLERSTERFEAQADQETGPVVRAYGMSFVNNILKAVSKQRPDLAIDTHGGPSAPPNFTYAMFEEDRGNRRAGDIAVLGILSSSVPAMAALSNSTWSFEQPAPYTYPIYELDNGTLTRIEPLLDSQADLAALRNDSAERDAWLAQLKAEDAFYSVLTYGYPALDGSPFARLVRRSLGTSHVAEVETDILQGAVYPYTDVLQQMITSFAQTARQDGQIPVVMLIQSNDPTDADILAIAKPALERDNIPYLATAEHFDPADPSGFQPDGHYLRRIDKIFAQAFLQLITAP